MVRIRCYTPAQVARAFQVSVSTVVRLLVQYDVRVLPIGKRYRIPERELERLLSQLPALAELKIGRKWVERWKGKRAASNSIERIALKDCA